VLGTGNSRCLRSRRSGYSRIHRFRNLTGFFTGPDGNPGAGPRSIDGLRLLTYRAPRPDGFLATWLRILTTPGTPTASEDEVTRSHSRPPLQHLRPATPVQFGLGAVLPHSNTPARNASRSDAGGPSLRVAGFPDTLPVVASRSFRRRGEVGRTTTRTRTKRPVSTQHCEARPPELECFLSSLWELRSGGRPLPRMRPPTPESNRRLNPPATLSHRKLLRI